MCLCFSVSLHRYLKPSSFLSGSVVRDALNDPPPSSSSVEVRSPYRRYRRSKEVWASFYAPQLSGNSIGCGCHHLHSVDIRYGGKSDLEHHKARRKAVCLNFTSLLSPRGPVNTRWKQAPFTASELQFAQKRGRWTSIWRRGEKHKRQAVSTSLATSHPVPPKLRNRELNTAHLEPSHIAFCRENEAARGPAGALKCTYPLPIQW